eukprot:SAG11_NODE_15933_length_562_cov_0.801296_2_plen_88_part_00
MTAEDPLAEGSFGKRLQLLPNHGWVLLVAILSAALAQVRHSERDARGGGGEEADTGSQEIDLGEAFGATAARGEAFREFDHAIRPRW